MPSESRIEGSDTSDAGFAGDAEIMSEMAAAESEGKVAPPPAVDQRSHALSLEALDLGAQLLEGGLRLRPVVHHRGDDDPLHREHGIVEVRGLVERR